MYCIGVGVGLIIMMCSGPALAQDVPEGQECCVCAKDAAAFDEMVAEACRERYRNEGVENPTEAQLDDCIRKLKIDVLENCSEATKRSAAGDDRDWDGIPDDQDNCPDVPNPRQAQTDPNVKENGKCRFIDNGDGTVTDAPNRRDWLKNAYSAGRRMTWDEANAYCQGLNVAGGGWRLPGREEFIQFIEEARRGSLFTHLGGAYWISEESVAFGLFPLELFPTSAADATMHVWPARNTRTH